MPQGKTGQQSIVIAISLLLLVIPTPSWAAEQSENTAVGITGVIINATNNIVDGTGAQAGLGDRNTAIGVGAAVINGDNNKVTGYGAIAALGNDNTAIGVGAVVVGGNNQQVIGYGAQAMNGSYNTAIGSESHAGGNASSISSYNTAIGYGAQATTGNSVALGAYSIADRPNSVSVGSYGYERQITNVAPGVYDTDAVNMSQLRGVSNRVNRVGATAFAFSALAPLPYDPKEPTQYSAGIGTYNGTGAVAIGIYHYTKPGAMLNAAIGISNDGWEKSARFGISWRTGGPKRKELTPAIPTITKKTVIDRVNEILHAGERPQ